MEWRLHRIEEHAGTRCVFWGLSVDNSVLLRVSSQSCAMLTKDAPFLDADVQMMRGSETTHSEPTYRSERDQQEKMICIHPYWEKEIPTM